MYDVYQIKRTDTLEKIANNFKTNINTILDINNLSYDSSLREGMEIIVPKDKVNYFDYYTIKKGDTLYEIAKKYNINPQLLSHINGLNMNDYIYPGQVILIPLSGYEYYITINGNSLDGIAKIFNTDISKLIKDNETIYLLEDQLLVKKK